MKANNIKQTLLAIALVTAGGQAAASMLAPAGSGMHTGGYDMSADGITPSSGSNFENDVRMKLMKKGRQGSRGTKLVVKGKKIDGSFFNSTPSDMLDIDGGRYKLKARFDTDGNLIKGRLKIKGTAMTATGEASGKLFTARLSDYVLTDNLLGFNTYDVTCDALIESLSTGGCNGGESVYISLKKSLADMTGKFRSKGLAITGLGAGATQIAQVSAVPVPAAVWLFGSGLLGLVGMARRRK